LRRERGRGGAIFGRVVRAELEQQVVVAVRVVDASAIRTQFSEGDQLLEGAVEGQLVAGLVPGEDGERGVGLAVKEGQALGGVGEVLVVVVLFAFGQG
jgi:hypothetical protein